jgi:hypothetical protein
MVTKCANPDCSIPLRYLRDGRLFQFEVRSPAPSRKLSRQVAHFWLCGSCSSTLTLAFDATSGVRVVPLVPLHVLEPSRMGASAAAVT